VAVFSVQPDYLFYFILFYLIFILFYFILFYFISSYLILLTVQTSFA